MMMETNIIISNTVVLSLWLPSYSTLSLSLLQEKNQKSALVLFLPIVPHLSLSLSFCREERRRKFCTVALYKIESLFLRSLSQTYIPQQEFIVWHSLWERTYIVALLTIRIYYRKGLCFICHVDVCKDYLTTNSFLLVVHHTSKLASVF